MDEPPSLLKNVAPRIGNSLMIRLVTPAGSDAIGARVTLISEGKKQIDEVRSGGSFISHNDFRLHFGLGRQTLPIYRALELTEKPKIIQRSRRSDRDDRGREGHCWQAAVYFCQALTVLVI